MQTFRQDAAGPLARRPVDELMMPELEGRRVFVVEDETYVAFLLEDMLADLGCDVMPVASTVADALARVGAGAIDVAVLDVNVAGSPVFPVAEVLQERGVPFVFSTGYGAVGLPERWRSSPVVPKPFLVDDLKAGLMRALGLQPG